VESPYGLPIPRDPRVPGPQEEPTRKGVLTYYLIIPPEGIDPGRRPGVRQHARRRACAAGCRRPKAGGPEGPRAHHPKGGGSGERSEPFSRKRRAPAGAFLRRRRSRHKGEAPADERVLRPHPKPRAAYAPRVALPCLGPRAWRLVVGDRESNALTLLLSTYHLTTHTQRYHPHNHKG
jgi:hypothetical protein